MFWYTIKKLQETHLSYELWMELKTEKANSVKVKKKEKKENGDQPSDLLISSASLVYS